MKNIEPEEVAQFLRKIYDTSFGGKERGRYRISRKELSELSGRKRLEYSIIDKIVDEAYEVDLVVIDLGDYFAVVESDVMLNYRKSPRELVKKLLEEKKQKLNKRPKNQK